MVFKTMSEYQNCSWTHMWKSSKIKDYVAAIQTDLVLHPGPKPRSYYGKPNSLNVVGIRAATYTPQQTGALASCHTARSTHLKHVWILLGCNYSTFTQQNKVSVASPCDRIVNRTIIAIFLKSSGKYSFPIRALSPNRIIPPAAGTTGCRKLNVSATKPELLLPWLGRQKATVSGLHLFSHLGWVWHIRICPSPNQPHLLTLNYVIMVFSAQKVMVFEPDQSRWFPPQIHRVWRWMFSFLLLH